MNTFLAFLGGTIVGTCGGFIILSLAITSKKADKHIEAMEAIRRSRNENRNI